MREIFIAAAALGLVFSAPASAAVTLQVNASGELTGATGLNVGGTLYDVQFVDGTCSDVFTGCDGLSDFTFSTLTEANAAGQALLGQVLIDTSAGNFDTNIALTLGCEVNIYATCTMFIPYGLEPGDYYVNVGNPGNTNAEAGDMVYGQGLVPRTQLDTSLYPHFVWARFSLSSGVPEASTWAMMLLGFGGIGAAMRRQRKSIRAPMLKTTRAAASCPPFRLRPPVLSQCSLRRGL